MAGSQAGLELVDPWPVAVVKAGVHLQTVARGGNEINPLPSAPVAAHSPRTPHAPASAHAHAPQWHTAIIAKVAHASPVAHSAKIAHSVKPSLVSADQRRQHNEAHQDEHLHCRSEWRNTGGKAVCGCT